MRLPRPGLRNVEGMKFPHQCAVTIDITISFQHLFSIGGLPSMTKSLPQHIVSSCQVWKRLKHNWCRLGAATQPHSALFSLAGFCASQTFSDGPRNLSTVCLGFFYESDTLSTSFICLPGLSVVAVVFMATFVGAIDRRNVARTDPGWRDFSGIRTSV